MNSLLLVGKFYRMDPQTEDLLSSGRKLEPGMVVLIENPSLRENPERVGVSNATMSERLLVQNRWCEVVEITQMDLDGHVIFIGQYPDGEKRQRRVSIEQAWYVKKDSLPKETYPEPGKVVEEERDISADKAFNGPAETVTFEQLGTGRKVTLSKSELDETEKAAETLRENFSDADIQERLVDEGKQARHHLGVVTDISEDEDGLKIEGTLTEEGAAYVQADADATTELMPDDEDYEEGPLVRAMRQFEPQLREKRTVTKNEVTEIYGPGRTVFGRPFYDGRRRY